MQVLLSRQILRRLQRELRRAGRQEIGGLLMGQHVCDETFRVVDVSIQRSGGSDVCFIRDPKDHQAQLNSFFARTGADYARFNYLGEWHSHPSFQPLPSSTDLRTMQSIVENPDVGVNFALLLIVRRSKTATIEASVVAFRKHAAPLAVPLIIEEFRAESDSAFLKWLRRVIKL